VVVLDLVAERPNYKLEVIRAVKGSQHVGDSLIRFLHWERLCHYGRISMFFIKYVTI